MIKNAKLGVLVSGRGSNLQSIIDNIEKGKLNAEIAVVISDVGDAYALERVRKYNIKTCFVNPKDFKDRSGFFDEIAKTLEENNVEYVILAGFMRIIPLLLINEYRNKMLNIHPALLPSFPGLGVQKKALEYGVKYSGCTVHFVDEGCDTGTIILQAVVPVLDNDTEKTLSQRILKEEHRIYPEAIDRVINGKVKIVGRRVIKK
ncbi:MAG: phosphoribosylglycinamide formyltransferase [bacterium]